MNITLPRPAAATPVATVIRQGENAVDVLAPATRAGNITDAVALSTACKQAALAEALAPPFDTAEHARSSALATLRGGLLAGALDGLVIISAKQLISDPSIGEGTPMAHAAAQLASAMKAGREVAATQWTKMPIDDMQLLTAYGKHENMQTADEAAAQVGHPAAETGPWLLATFKAGYAIGLADAVLLAQDQRPDDPEAG